MAAARVVTAVAGVLMTNHPDPILAGLWAPVVLNNPATWKRLAPNAFAPYPNLPVGLWGSQHPFNDEKSGGIGVVTQGLARFVGRELELIAATIDLKALLDRAFGLTVYLIQNGPVLKDGSTFGVSETERIAVRLCQSERFTGLHVISGLLTPVAR